MKLHYLLLASVVWVASCKKHDEVKLPKPAPPTKDFREKYTGTFNITKLHVHSTYPRGVSTSTSDTFTGTLQITYLIGDSISNGSKFASGGDYFSQSALTFIYDNGTKELLGVDSLGQLYRKTIPGGSNQGGFITADSLFHYSRDYGHSRSDEVSLYGKRVK